jgi:hypothetical protein
MVAVAEKDFFKVKEIVADVSLATFMKKYYNNRSKGYKYEFNKGKVEKFDALKRVEIFIYGNLLRCFMYSKAFAAKHALVCEVDTWTSEVQYRRPDISYWTKEQKFSETNEVPLFACEVISPTDNINLVNQKIEEYFGAGMKVLWHIFPKLNMVYVYHSPTSVTICKGEDICSAAPAVPDLEITVNQLFSKE